jgi:hypothetical protein
MDHIIHIVNPGAEPRERRLAGRARMQLKLCEIMYTTSWEADRRADGHGYGIDSQLIFSHGLSEEVIAIATAVSPFSGIRPASMFAKTPSMNSWFVSTIRAKGVGAHREVEWLLNECETEQDAKELAAGALSRGLRVEE